MFLFHFESMLSEGGKGQLLVQTLAQWMEIYMNIVPPHPPAPHGKLVLDSVYESQDSGQPCCGGSNRLLWKPQAQFELRE